VSINPIIQSKTHLYVTLTRDSKVGIGEYMSDTCPVQNGLKQGDALSLLLFNFALDYGIKKAQEKWVRLKLNGKHQLLAYADDVNLLGDNIDTIKEKQRNCNCWSMLMM
jgi:hypothetical protein